MKQAKTYETKVRALLKALPKAPKRTLPEHEDPLRVLVHAALQPGATAKQASAAMEAIDAEYVDLNELRVSPTKDIIECLGEEYPDARRKADAILEALGRIYLKANAVSMEFVQAMPKREARRALAELGLDEYTAACVMLSSLSGHAVPVDEDLAEVLVMDELAHPESDRADIQSFLERVVPAKDGKAVHEFLRSYVQKRSKALAKKRRDEAAALAKEQARVEAETAAEQEAQKLESRAQEDDSSQADGSGEDADDSGEGKVPASRKVGKLAKGRTRKSADAASARSAKPKASVRTTRKKAKVASKNKKS